MLTTYITILDYISQGGVLTNTNEDCYEVSIHGDFEHIGILSQIAYNPSTTYIEIPVIPAFAIEKLVEKLKITSKFGRHEITNVQDFCELVLTNLENLIK